MYRSLEDTIWMLPLSRDTKLLYLYLITAPQSHYSGIYQLDQMLASTETDLPAANLQASMQELADGGRLVLHGNTLWMPKMARHNITSPKQVVGVAKRLEQFYHTPLQLLYLESNPKIKQAWPGDPDRLNNTPYDRVSDTLQEAYRMGYAILSKELIKELSKEVLSGVPESTCPDKTVGGEVSSKKPKPKYQAVRDYWDDICSTVGLPPADGTIEEQTAIKAIWSQYHAEGRNPRDELMYLFKVASVVPHYQGTNGSRWKATLTWVCNNRSKVMQHAGEAADPEETLRKKGLL